MTLPCAVEALAVPGGKPQRPWRQGLAAGSSGDERMHVVVNPAEKALLFEVS